MVSGTGCHKSQVSLPVVTSGCASLSFELRINCVHYLLQTPTKSIFTRRECHSCPLCSQMLLLPLGVPPMPVPACLTCCHDTEVCRVLTTTDVRNVSQGQGVPDHQVLPISGACPGILPWVPFDASSCIAREIPCPTCPAKPVLHSFANNRSSAVNEGLPDSIKSHITNCIA